MVEGMVDPRVPLARITDSACMVYRNLWLAANAGALLEPLGVRVKIETYGVLRSVRGTFRCVILHSGLEMVCEGEFNVGRRAFSEAQTIIIFPTAEIEIFCDYMKAFGYPPIQTMIKPRWSDSVRGPIDIPIFPSGEDCVWLTPIAPRSRGNWLYGYEL